jgi:hypothetical protein
MRHKGLSAVSLSVTLVALSTIVSASLAACQQDSTGAKTASSSSAPSGTSSLENSAAKSSASGSSNDSSEGCHLLPYAGKNPLRDVPNYFEGEEDFRAGMTCTFSIHSALPVFTFHFIGRDNNSFGNIEIRKGNDDRVIQTIENETDPGAVTPQQAEDVLSAVDANFDGNNDLQVLNNCGGTGNCSYDFYLYDPATNKFVHNDFLSNLSSPEFHDENKQVTTHSHGSASDWENDTYQYEKGRYTLIHQEISAWDRATNVVTISTYELRNGKMVLVDSKTDSQ